VLDPITIHARALLARRKRQFHTCARPSCATVFEGVTQAKWCSATCRQWAWRHRCAEEQAEQRAALQALEEQAVAEQRERLKKRRRRKQPD
jgi:hypothetical protein